MQHEEARLVSLVVSRRNDTGLTSFDKVSGPTSEQSSLVFSAPGLPRARKFGRLLNAAQPLRSLSSSETTKAEPAEPDQACVTSQSTQTAKGRGLYAIEGHGTKRKRTNLSQPSKATSHVDQGEAKSIPDQLTVSLQCDQTGRASQTLMRLPQNSFQASEVSQRCSLMCSKTTFADQSSEPEMICSKPPRQLLPENSTAASECDHICVESLHEADADGDIEVELDSEVCQWKAGILFA